MSCSARSTPTATARCRATPAVPFEGRGGATRDARSRAAPSALTRRARAWQRGVEAELSWVTVRDYAVWVYGLPARLEGRLQARYELELVAHLEAVLGQLGSPDKLVCDVGLVRDFGGGLRLLAARAALAARRPDDPHLGVLQAKIAGLQRDLTQRKVRSALVVVSARRDVPRLRAAFALGSPLELSLSPARLDGGGTHGRGGWLRKWSDADARWRRVWCVLQGRALLCYAEAHAEMDAAAGGAPSSRSMRAMNSGSGTPSASATCGVTPVMRQASGCGSRSSSGRQ